MELCLGTWEYLTSEERSLTSNYRKLQSQKSARTKQKLAKAQKQNRPIPQWIRLRTGNTIRYDPPHPSIEDADDDLSPRCSTGPDDRWHWHAENMRAERASSSSLFLADGNANMIDRTATTRRGGTGARPVWASKRIAPTFSLSDLCPSRNIAQRHHVFGFITTT